MFSALLTITYNTKALYTMPSLLYYVHTHVTLGNNGAIVVCPSACRHRAYLYRPIIGLILLRASLIPVFPPMLAV